MKLLTTILATLLLLLSSTFTAKVVRVSDGDTITVLTDEKEQIRIRLEGIDCPESGQPFGNRARELTAKLVAGKEVRIDKSGEDRYGRTLGYVWIGDKCVNHELLKAGLAWHYKYFNKDPKLAEMENIAKAAKLGLWSEPNPVAPWDWRRR